MYRRTLALLLALVLVIGLVPATAGATPAYVVGEEFPVSLADEGQIQPDIDYPWIVWKDNRDCEYYEESEDEQSDIYAYNFITGAEVQVSSHEGSESNPSISGTRVVYSHDTDGDSDCGIYLYDLSTGEERLLSEFPGIAQGNPSIDGDIVVHNHWDYSSPNSGDIWAYDLSDDTTFAVTARVGDQYEPDIADGWVVYRDRDESYSIGAYNLESGEETLVAQGVNDDDYWGFGDASTDDGKMVCQQWGYINSPSSYDYAICMFDLETGEKTTLSTVNDTSDRRHPVIGDGLVTWHDHRVGEYEVYGYDLETEEETCIVPAVWDEEAGDGGDWISYAGRTTTADGIVAWHDHRDEGINEDGIDDNDDLYAMFVRTVEAPEAGDTRYATAVEVSQDNFPDGADTVIVATGQNFPDALAGSPLAGLYGAPVLLVSDTIPPEVAAEIERLGATSAVVLGREVAVPYSVDGELEDLGLEVMRLGGADRFDTANLIAEEVVDMMGDGWDGTAFLATGYDWPDALSAGPLAAATGWPIFLGGPEGDPITEKTAAAMDDLGVELTYVIGGPSVISAGDSGGIQATALSGEDRYETAVAIAQFGVDEVGLSMGTLAIATGERYPDALTAGPAQGMNGGSLLITPGASTSAAIMDEVEANAGTIAVVKFIGGLEAITQSVRDSIMGLLP